MGDTFYMSYASTGETPSVGNSHVSQDLQSRWPTYNFLGKPFRLLGRMFIRAFHKTLEKTHFYDFEKDWFWWEAPPIEK